MDLATFHHKRKEHGDGWALVAVFEELFTLAQTINTMSTSLDNLTATVAGVSADLTDLTASVNTAITDLGAGSAGDAQLDTLNSSLTSARAVITGLKTQLDAATAAIVPPPAPAPAPAPTP